MKKSDAFPSKYLSAADLAGKPRVVTILSTSYEELGQRDGRKQEKLICHFRDNRVKPLVVNMVNFDTIADVTGEGDSDDWPGHQIEVFPTTTSLGNRTVPCIRVRKPTTVLPLKPAPAKRAAPAPA